MDVDTLFTLAEKTSNELARYQAILKSIKVARYRAML